MGYRVISSGTAAEVGGKVGRNPKRIIACGRTVEQLRSGRGIFVGVIGIENVLQVGFQSALVSVRQVMFIRQLDGKLAPVGQQIAVAIHAHGRVLPA